ncbi:hypothetical protein KVT40_004251 [Elsinoe batatas]|uniref:Uncharacterized protein n=1 Tax=Elsinoe batatas TaxID=2601811 RepID=A0A8K0PID7_9PEZI|nr:hypothetical protein KVT40_004251 [Elsinoe batatas]
MCHTHILTCPCARATLTLIDRCRPSRDGPSCLLESSSSIVQPIRPFPCDACSTLGTNWLDISHDEGKVQLHTLASEAPIEASESPSPMVAPLTGFSGELSEFELGVLCVLPGETPVDSREGSPGREKKEGERGPGLFSVELVEVVEEQSESMDGSSPVNSSVEDYSRPSSAREEDRRPSFFRPGRANVPRVVDQEGYSNDFVEVARTTVTSWPGWTVEEAREAGLELPGCEEG